MTILSVGVGIFFYPFSGKEARADYPEGRIGSLYLAADYPFNLSRKNVQRNAENDQADREKRRREEKILRLVGGYPIENMVGHISKLDDRTAAFLIAIAKKESDWGKHSPKSNGRDCYNYWGFKGKERRILGYSCFDSPQEAVEKVGNRISDLIDKKIDTAGEMVVWKCGSSCAGHDPQGVRKWISDVDLYYKKLDL